MGNGNKITTQLPDPSFNDIFPKVCPLLILTQQALEYAVPKAKEFFDHDKRELDRYLFPTLIRYYARSYLAAAGQPTESDDELVATSLTDEAPQSASGDTKEYLFYGLPNNGLSGVFRGFPFRMFMAADDGQLPGPGLSKTRRRYFNQQLSLPLGVKYQDDGVVRVNLIITYELDNDHNFLRQHLACPRSADKWKLSVETFFDEIVPDAAEMIQPVSSEHLEEEELIVTKKTKEETEQPDDIRRES